MAEEEPQVKKFKHSVISDFILSSEFQQLFFENWHNFTDVKTDNLEIISKPFRVCRISNFIGSEELMDEIKNDLLDIKYRRNIIDLYQFEQTEDLANSDAEYIKLLYETFQTDFAAWLEKNTKIELNKVISMSSSCYYDTDYLLCHDDNLGDRRIAYVLYISKEWTAEDGGTLDLFDTDENGLPRDVVKSLVPEYNSLVFFEVLDNSYHQVAEVVSPEKSRWSINGWFHGPIRQSDKPPRLEIEPDGIPPIDETFDLNQWVTECYLFTRIKKDIHWDMEKDSYTYLPDYLKDDIFEKLSTDLLSETIVWKKVGPADIRNYEVAEEETLPESLKNLCKLFKSITMFQLLKEYTELDLIAESESMNPRVVMELQRWCSGCYTLICDKPIASDYNAQGSDVNDSSDNDDDMPDDGPSSNKDLDGPSPNKDLDGPSTSNGLDGPSTSNGLDGPSTSNGLDGPPASNGLDGPSASNGLDGLSASNGLDGLSAMNGLVGPPAVKMLLESPSTIKRLDGPPASNGLNGASSNALNNSTKEDPDKSNSDNKTPESDCDAPLSPKEDEVECDDEVLKKILKTKSPRTRKKYLAQHAALLKMGNRSPQKPRVLDTDDSDVSDIGDYLSDPLDCSLDDEENEEENAVVNPNAAASGSLDVILQFHAGNAPQEESVINYLDPMEEDSAVIIVPTKDNHLSIVYKTGNTCRIHKYVNHYYPDYFYNLVCTYYE